jgi:hypothetical protein
MPECAFHPGVETNVRCVECDRYMCPKDFVTTPVGYKCRECARQLRSARREIKPKQLAISVVAALAVGVGGALALAMLGFYWWLATIALGALTGEAARRGSGGHRGSAIAAVAGSSALLGTFLAGFGVLQMALATGAAVLYVTSNRW